MNEQVFGAIDIGASGGRVIAGVLSGPSTSLGNVSTGSGSVRLDVVHRFPNGAKPGDDGALHWDIRTLFAEVLTGLSALAERYPDVISVSIDSWAVDYGLIDAAGELVGDPFSYRDDRTSAVLSEVHDRIDPELLYRITGLQFLPFNTIYQFAAEPPDVWSRAATALLIPDLLAFWLTGVRAAEATNASTTGLFDATAGEWSMSIIDQLGIPRSVLPRIVAPGTVLGPLLPEIAAQTGLPASTVLTAVGSHDTASAVVGVPASSPNFAYISSGTWSLVGVELERPVLTEESRLANFTNERGVDGSIRYLRNTGGLWLLQESIKEWRRAGLDVDLDQLLAGAAVVPAGGPVIDASDDRFIAPGSMPQRIIDACAEAGAPLPSITPEYVTRCIIDSLATAYATTLADAARLSGHEIKVVHIVGGGSQNTLLCQATADVSGLPVVAGPVEATALGNILVQARAHGAVTGSLDDLRSLANTSALRHYAPAKNS